MVEIPGYKIERELGAGGMATVFLAIQESLGREVALKIMTPGLAVDETYCHRFLKEGRITAQLSHPNLLTVYDTGVHENHYYMASEFLSEGTARDKMRAGMSHDEIIKIIAETASGLGFAHSKGFVHRDVKPGNLLFRMNGDCVLGDFGIAKSVDSNTGATKLGTSIGTPHYMSPEQAKGEKVDHRTDLYSLGVVFFELLTGKPPFDAADPFSVALMQIKDPVPQLPAEHARFQGLIERLMHKDREQRFATGEEFIAALRSDTGGGTAAPTPPPVSKPEPQRQVAQPQASAPPRQKLRDQRSAGFPVVKLVVGITALIVVAAGSYLVWDRMSSDSDDPVEQPVATQPKPVPEPPDDGGDTPAPEPFAAELTRAREHISAGRFLSPPGNNAREEYRRILNGDSRNDKARRGLDQLPVHIRRAADSALSDGELKQALDLLEEAVRVFPNDNGLKNLLGQAQERFASSQPPVEDPATSDPATPDPVVPDPVTPPVRVDDSEIAELIRLGDKYFDANIFSHPPGENATDVYLRVMAMDPDNTHVRGRLDEIAGTWARIAEINIRRGKTQIARRMIEKGLQASPQNQKLLDLEQRLKDGG